MATQIFKINDIEYECEFVLSNPDKQKISYTKSAIRGMTLVDNIFEPFMSGSISLANPYDYMESEYFIRGDGRDEFMIKFKPKDSKDKEDFFEQTFVVIDDYDTINPFTRAENFKTFSLVSKDAIGFFDKIPYSKVYSGKIGNLIKDVFQDVLGKDKVDESNWEQGDLDMTYSPPATFRYMDLLNYLIRMFYAKDGDLHVKGFIGYDPLKKKYQLKLLSKIFQENQKNVKEAFGLADLVTNLGTDDPNNPPPGPPVGEYTGQLKGVGYSTPLYSWTTDHFQNSLVVGYDSNLGQEKITKLNFDDVKKKWKSKFVDSFTSKGGKPKAFAIKNKSTDKRFKRFKFPYPVETGVKIVEAEIHNALTFYNLQIYFSNVGRAGRSSGTFIDVFSPRKIQGDFKPLKSHEKLLGRWYVTQITHVFFADLYTNSIMATKTYIGPNANVNEKVD